MRRPTMEDLDKTGIYLQRVVPQEYEDLNGHVNMGRHFQMMLEGAENLYQHTWGIDTERAKTLHEGSFTLSQQQNFYREIMIGEEVSVHVRLLDRSAKIIHGMLILFNRTTGEVATTNEFVDGYVDLKARKIIEMPESIAQMLDTILAEHRELDWELPLSKSLGVRS